jgi:chromate reductase, NAD(P)H dehydrogenase (quinone)
MSKILAFAGSARSASFNKQLIRIAVSGARLAGAEVMVVDLRDLPMPIYDGDFEAKEGLPANVKAFKNLLKSHHGLLISSPEYNSSLPALLKNAIDWASRAEAGEPALACFAGKVAGLMSASPGAFGGMRCLVHLRAILGNIKVLVVPEQVSVAKANEAFNPDGTLKDAKLQTAVSDLGGVVARLTAKLSG